MIEGFGTVFAGEISVSPEAAITTGSIAPGTITAPVEPSMIRGLDYSFLQVRRMMAFFGQEFPDTPTLLTPDLIARRAKWIRSEVDELEDPTKQTIKDQCDAFLDMIVFAMGGLVEAGVLPQNLLDFVIESQFGKVHDTPEGPQILKDADGKVIKPSNWEADFAPEPKMQAEIARQEAAGLLRQIAA